MTGKPLAILPMQLEVGDRFTDEEGEWEVANRPYTTRAGKVVPGRNRCSGAARFRQQAEEQRLRNEILRRQLQ